MKRRLLAIFLAAAVLTGCATGAVNPSEEQTSDTSSTAAPTVTTDPEQTLQSSVKETQPLPIFAETDMGEMDFSPAECYKLYEAEDGELYGYAKEASLREGFSGRGYVSGASLPDSGVVMNMDIESSQHYSLTICAAADRSIDGAIYVDDVAVGSFSFEGVGSFEAVKIDNIYMPTGKTEIGIKDLSGECDIDFILLENARDIYNLDYSVSGELCSKASSEKTAKTFKYLCELYGDVLISSQQCSQGSNTEIDAIAAVTGKYPAIRFGELMGYSAGVDTGDIELAIEYANNGGLIGYVWNWMKNGSCYLDKSGFDIKKVMTDHDAAKFSPERIEELASNGGITAECAETIREIDLIAEQLKRLSEEGIPVIFRPLPEAGNGSFWWGADRESYLKLYRLIYDRLTAYHRLNNIIWVWNAQNLDWYVGDDYCDIISLDIYDYSNSQWDNQSYISAMLRLNALSGEKPLAISECNVLPAPANIAKDNAYWLYASLWSGDCATDETGELSERYISRAEWIVFYNCSNVVTRDRLISIN